MSEKVEVVLGRPEPKKHSVRYNAVEGDNAGEPALTSAYVSNEAVQAIGDPPKVKITIEAA